MTADGAQCRVRSHMHGVDRFQEVVACGMSAQDAKIREDAAQNGTADDRYFPALPCICRHRFG